MTISINTKTPQSSDKLGGFKAKPKANPHKKLYTWLAGVLAVLLLTAGAWALWPTRVPPPTADAGTLAKFMASDKFAKMTSEQQKPYLDVLRKDPREFFDASRKVLSDEERRTAFENMFARREQEQMDGFFKLPTKAERDKYLDKMIDDGEKRRKEWEARRAADGNNQNRGNWAGRGGGGGSRGMTASGLKSRMEKTPPEAAAKRAEFRAAMSKRREERGLPNTGGPGGGGGGR